MGYDYQADLSKHQSQTDGSKGFGGKYGVQKSKDKVCTDIGYSCSCIDIIMCVCVCLPQSAVGYDYQADLSKHESQTDASKGFGGKYGVQKDNRDKV